MERKDWYMLLWIVLVFGILYFVPSQTDWFRTSILSAFDLLHDYAQKHVLTCLVPALFIAGAISVFVKKDVVLNKDDCNLKSILEDYLSSTAYISQVIIDELPTIEVNEALFCTAVDNLIRNGLKYNDSDTKFVKITSDENNIYIQDNGRGITQEDFDHLSKPYIRKEGQKESGTGLGLNICVAILEEHGFIITCEKNEIGTKIKIKIK